MLHFSSTFWCQVLCKCATHRGFFHHRVKKKTHRCYKSSHCCGFEPAQPQQWIGEFLSCGRVWQWEFPPFFSYLGCWCGRSQQWPPRSHTDGWGWGGLGRGAEEFWFGTPCTARQPGGERGWSQAQCKHGLLLLERRKPRSHNQSTALLLGQLNCELPLSPTELGQYFTELRNGLWDVSQK